jgi:hypothetical protein
MLRVFVWRAIRIFRFESNSWIVFLLFVQKDSMRWKYKCTHRCFCESSSFLNRIFESFLYYSCVKFSLWFVHFIDIKKFERLISSVHFIDVKKFRTTHLSINNILCYTFFVVHHIKSHCLSKLWLFHEIFNVKMSIVFSTSLEILFSLYQSRKKWN